MTKEEINIDVLREKYSTIESEKLNGLLVQVHRLNPDVYIKPTVHRQKTRRWWNPFKTVVTEQIEYTMYKFDKEGVLIAIHHDYNSLKSYLIGYVEGSSAARRAMQKESALRRG